MTLQGSEKLFFRRARQEEAPPNKWMLGLVLAVSLSLLSGCASTLSSTQSPPLVDNPPNLSAYKLLTVLPFDSAEAGADAGFGQKFAAEICYRVRNDFGTFFSEVRREDKPLGREDELVVSGRILRFVHGSEAISQAGLLGAVAGSSAFNAEVHFTQGNEKVPFFTGTNKQSKLLLGSGIDAKLQTSAASVANTIARGKGWASSQSN